MKVKVRVRFGGGVCGDVSDIDWDGEKWGWGSDIKG